MQIEDAEDLLEAYAAAVGPEEDVLLLVDLFGDIIGASEAIGQLITRAKLYAEHDSNLLISGETGTGKEVIAQSVHNHSRRKSSPFVSVNVASIPATLLESELFGYVDGAFTGARKGGKPGLFELAHEGTLFLDEIGELPLSMQKSFLRVLQDRHFRPVGGKTEVSSDFRLVAATNRDLDDMVRRGQFREGLRGEPARFGDQRRHLVRKPAIIG